VILASNTPALSQLGRDTEGGMMGINFFDAQLTNLVEFVGAKMSPAQIRECAELAYEECYWFTFAELKQFILRIKTGVYTSNKNFSPLVFMEFLRMYAEERLCYRYDHYSQLKPKKKVILSIDHLQGKSRKVAMWLCKQVEIRNAHYIQKMKDIIQQTAEQMGEPIKDVEDDAEYKRIRTEYITNQMKQKAKQQPDENRDPQ